VHWAHWYADQFRLPAPKVLNKWVIQSLKKPSSFITKCIYSPHGKPQQHCSSSKTLPNVLTITVVWQKNILLFRNMHRYQWKVSNCRHASDQPLEICNGANKHDYINQQTGKTSNAFIENRKSLTMWLQLHFKRSLRPEWIKVSQTLARVNGNERRATFLILVVRHETLESAVDMTHVCFHAYLKAVRTSRK